jgi:glycosyltransferase involved in cell wall biosynthesis
MIGFKPKTPDLSVASVRYRCLLPAAELCRRGFPAQIYRPEADGYYAAVVFSKLYDRSHQELAKRLRGAGTKVVLDLCDNHFYNPYDLPAYAQARRDLLSMLRLADRVVCSTPALADVVREEAGLELRPEVVGDPVEPAPLAPDGVPDGVPRLLWFGSHGAPNAPCGMSDLKRIAPALARARAIRDFELVVSSNDRARYERDIRPLPLRTSYVDWTRDGFPALLASAWAVVIPVTPNPFTVCKSNNRLVAALAAGVPALADSIPSYEEFSPYCRLGSWDEGLRELLSDPQGARARARAARGFLAERWSEASIGTQWLDVLGALAGAEARA